MKKLSALLIVLCLAVSLFAAATVKVGGSYESIIGYTNEFKSAEQADSAKYVYKGHGFGFNVATKYSVSGKLATWATFGMSFLSDVKIKPENGTDWLSIKEMYDDMKTYEMDKLSKKTYALYLSAGVAVELPLNAPVEVALGGGISLERVMGQVAAKDGDLEYLFGVKFINVGIAGYAEAAYKINDNIAVGLTIMPRLGILDFSKYYAESMGKKFEAKAGGFRLGFSMPVVLGASYSF